MKKIILTIIIALIMISFTGSCGLLEDKQKVRETEVAIEKTRNYILYLERQNRDTNSQIKTIRKEYKELGINDPTKGGSKK